MFNSYVKLPEGIKKTLMQSDEFGYRMGFPGLELLTA
jgi:hypothetical protein